MSPYQLALGTNSRLPSLHNAKALTLASISTNKIISKNIQAIHCTREALIASEIHKNCEGPYRTTSDNIKYLTGDSVYYKCTNSNQWHLTVKILGQNGQPVLVKNSSKNIKVHPGQLQLASNLDLDNPISHQSMNNMNNTQLSNPFEYTFPKCEIAAPLPPLQHYSFRLRLSDLSSDSDSDNNVASDLKLWGTHPFNNIAQWPAIPNTD